MRTKKVLILVPVLCLAALALFLRPYYLSIAFGISDWRRDLGLKTPDSIVRIDNERYGEDRQQVFDVYYPAGTKEPLPVIVSIHGGGYTYGTKETYQYYCMDLAGRGFTVVNFTYRLAPKHRFPAQLQDVNAVLTMVCENADRYMADTDRVFFVGDSAGGHLNAMYSAAVTNPAYAELLGITVPSFTLLATALNCGVYEQEDAFSGSMEYVLDRDLPGLSEKLDITGHLTENFPPSFVMSSTGDMCLPFAEPMAERLKALGVETVLHIYGDQEKRLGHVFHLDIKSEDAKACNDDECAFFREHL